MDFRYSQKASGTSQDRVRILSQSYNHLGGCGSKAIPRLLLGGCVLRGIPRNYDDFLCSPSARGTSQDLVRILSIMIQLYADICHINLHKKYKIN